MISVKLTENVACSDFTELFDELIKSQIESVEFDVQPNKQHDPVILCHEVSENGDSAPKDVLLKDVFEFIQTEELQVELVLNLVESDLETKVNTLVKEYHLEKQVKYAGRIDPTHLSLWDRLSIYYDVENCLPTFYHFTEIKQHHVDVIHYFLGKYKIKTVRVRIDGVTDGFIHWAKENHIALSIYNVASMEEAEALRDMGVDYVSISSINMKASI